MSMNNHLELLACVARADGEVSVEEALALKSFMESAGMPEVAVSRVAALLRGDESIDVDAVVGSFARAATPWMLAEAIRDAYVIASVDGEVDASEISLVEKIFDLAGIPSEHRMKLHRWARNAAMQQLLGMTYLTATLERARRDREA
jgi:uncharacterized tellurite resistance protein B-like protein